MGLVQLVFLIMLPNRMHFRIHFGCTAAVESEALCNYTIAVRLSLLALLNGHDVFIFEFGQGPYDCVLSQACIFSQASDSGPAAVMLANPVDQNGKDYLGRGRQVTSPRYILWQLVKQHLVGRRSYVVYGTLNDI